MLVREMPLPATTIPPVRDDAELVATLNVIVPLPVPDAPLVMVIQETLEVAIHAPLAVTPIVFPLAAALDKLVLDGLIAKVVEGHNAVGRPAQRLGTVGQLVALASR